MSSEGLYGKHSYYLRLEYTILKVAPDSSRKVLREATTLVDGKLVTTDNPLFIKIEGDPVRTVENYIDRLET